MNKLCADNKCKDYYINWLKHEKQGQMAENYLCNDGIQEEYRKRLTKTSLKEMSIV